MVMMNYLRWKITSKGFFILVVTAVYQVNSEILWIGKSILYLPTPNLCKNSKYFYWPCLHLNPLLPRYDWSHSEKKPVMFDLWWQRVILHLCHTLATYLIKILQFIFIIKYCNLFYWTNPNFYWTIPKFYWIWLTVVCISCRLPTPKL